MAEIGSIDDPNDVRRARKVVRTLGEYGIKTPADFRPSHPVRDALHWTAAKLQGDADREGREGP